MKFKEFSKEGSIEKEIEVFMEKVLTENKDKGEEPITLDDMVEIVSAYFHIESKDIVNEIVNDLSMKNNWYNLEVNGHCTLSIKKEIVSMPCNQNSNYKAPKERMNIIVKRPNNTHN